MSAIIFLNELMAFKQKQLFALMYCFFITDIVKDMSNVLDTQCWIVRSHPCMIFTALELIHFFEVVKTLTKHACLEQAECFSWTTYPNTQHNTSFDPEQYTQKITPGIDPNLNPKGFYDFKWWKVLNIYYGTYPTNYTK